VLEAKEWGLPAQNGAQQAHEYTELLDLKFAYASNGRDIIEIDLSAGTERNADRYATPDELFARLIAAEGLPRTATRPLLEPFNLVSGKDELDRYGRPVPDEEYQTRDFERVIALHAQTRAMARHLTNFLKGTDRFAKTLVFCVDQEHAAEMRQELVSLNSDLMRLYPDYVCRVTGDEGDIGVAHLADFQDVDKPAPAILTTSQLLTTGVDAETAKNVVLARVVGSGVEFEQIIGRGIRLKVDYGKEYFNIIDFIGTATRHFTDPVSMVSRKEPRT
jgi:type I site-specific restriction endonuclease